MILPFWTSTSNKEASGLLKLLLRLETSINLSFWSDFLESVQVSNLQLQKDNSDLNKSIALLKSLKIYIATLREDFNKYEKLGKDNSGWDEYEKKRSPKQNVPLNPLDYGR